MTCPACASAALDWVSGYQVAGCEGCRVRAFAGAPPDLLDGHFRKLPDGPEKVALRDAVLTERRRIATLRAAQGTLPPASPGRPVAPERSLTARGALLGGALPPAGRSENRCEPASPDQGRSAGKARLLQPPGESTDG